MITRPVAYLWIVCGLLSLPVMGCVTTREYSPVANTNPRFKRYLIMLEKGETAFHAISDASIIDLRDDPAVVQRIQQLVTSARDEYRKMQSYGMPRLLLGGGLQVGQGWGSAKVIDARFVMDRHLNYNYKWLQPGTGLKISLYGSSAWWKPTLHWMVHSSRNLPICSGQLSVTGSAWRHGWLAVGDHIKAPIIHQPFYDILVGDGVADFDDLIIKIKRE